MADEQTAAGKGGDTSMPVGMNKPWYLLPENPADGLLSTAQWREIGALFGLTRRELDVAILIFEDRTRSSVARALASSPGSVRKRIDKVFGKLNVSDRLGMVQRVWQVHRTLFAPDFARTKRLGRSGGRKMLLATRLKPR